MTTEDFALLLILVMVVALARLFVMLAAFLLPLAALGAVAFLFFHWLGYD